MNTTENTLRLPSLDQLVSEIGDVGRLLAEMKTSEGHAGNISVCLTGTMDPQPLFPESRPYEAPGTFPELAGKYFLVTGSGCRLRDISRQPTANLALLKLGPDGCSGQLFMHPDRHFDRLTSEFNSHLRLHQREFQQPSVSFNAVVHAQPMYLTYLTHIEHYQDRQCLSDAVLRWQPELIVVFPIGFGFVPFRVPNSNDLMEATRDFGSSYPLIVWAKHGVVAISHESVSGALDLIEYVETGAHYEYLNLLNHEAGDGLMQSEIQAIRRHFDLPGQVQEPGS